MIGDGFQNLKILVVEKDRRMRSFLAAVLGDRDAGSYAEAADGEEALKVLRTFSPDVVVSGWVMEPMDGTELLGRLRRGVVGVSRLAPFIMVTSRSGRHWEATARDAGVTEFLVKPVSARDLYQAISLAVKSPRPFVHRPDYFGPDRRRRQSSFDGDDRRVSRPAFLSPPRFSPPPKAVSFPGPPPRRNRPAVPSAASSRPLTRLKPVASDDFEAPERR